MNKCNWINLSLQSTINTVINCDNVIGLFLVTPVPRLMLVLYISARFFGLG